MFGGANDNAATSADHQDEPAHDGMLSGTNGMPATPGAAGGFDAGTYGGNPVTAPASDAPLADPAATPPVDTPATDTPAQNSGDLLTIKQAALQQLSPLVGHLEQSPEEKFRTTMMMIQASDNADFIKDAFEAAQQITDDKARAQALLDIINEINYFTQHHEQQ